MASGERLIFIGGAPRSGTTLVQNMMDSHPTVFGGPEFLSLPQIVALRKRLHAHLDLEYISLYTNREGVDERLGKLIEDFLLPLADRHGYRLLSEKTPENVQVLTELGQLLPDARFIHVVRDPRAAIASMLEVGKRHRQKGLKPPPFTVSVRRAVRHLSQCYRAGFRAEREMPERVLTVAYEALVREPEPVARQLCDFLGLEWAPAMLAPGEQAHAGEHAILAGAQGSWYDTDSYYRNPDLASLDKWRTSLRPRQQAEIARAFRSDPDLTRLGYKLRLSSPQKATVWADAARRAARMSLRTLTTRLRPLIRRSRRR